MLLLAIAFIFVGQVYASDIYQGIRYFDQQDYLSALSAWQPLAKAGNAEAQIYTGVIYRYGLGVPIDKKTAAYWYAQAAKNGQPDAQYELALMYELGEGLEADPYEAAYWYDQVLDEETCPSDISATGGLAIPLPVIGQ